MIRAKGLSIHYPNQKEPVIKDMNLELSQGETGLIAGANSSGKTTALHALSGIIPTIQKANVNGSLKLSEKPGVTLQDSDVFLLPTAKEEIGFVLRNFGWDEGSIQARVLETLQIMKLEGLGNRPINTLSGGERQRVALAAAIAPGSSVIILDEPLTQLDRSFASYFLDYLNDLKATILIASTEIYPYRGIVEQYFLAENGYINSEYPSESLFNIARSYGIHVDGCEDLTLTHKTKSRDEDRGEVVLEIKNIDFAYPGEDYLLKNVNLQASKGDVVALVGDNGSGKTTLLKIIAGMLKPQKGSISVLGKSIKTLSIAEATKHTGFLFQNPDHQIFHDTISKELRWGLRIRKKEGVDAKTEYWLNKFGLSDIAEEHPYSHTKLIRQKVALASILAPEPELLLLDEPSHGMDNNETRYLIELIHKLSCKKRMAVLLVTHNHSLAISCATKVLELKGGSFQ